MTEPTRWEYATVPLLTHATKQILDQWGEDGWELVSVLPGPTGEQHVAYQSGQSDGFGGPGNRSGYQIAAGRHPGGGIRARRADRQPRLHRRAAADGGG